MLGIFHSSTTILNYILYSLHIILLVTTKIWPWISEGIWEESDIHTVGPCHSECSNSKMLSLLNGLVLSCPLTRLCLFWNVNIFPNRNNQKGRYLFINARRRGRSQKHTGQQGQQHLLLWLDRIVSILDSKMCLPLQIWSFSIV